MAKKKKKKKNIFQWGNPGERLSECEKSFYVSQKFHAKNHPEANP